MMIQQCVGAATTTTTTTKYRMENEERLEEPKYYHYYLANRDGLTLASERSMKLNEIEWFIVV